MQGRNNWTAYDCVEACFEEGVQQSLQSFVVIDRMLACGYREHLEKFGKEPFEEVIEAELLKDRGSTKVLLLRIGNIDTATIQ